LGSLLVARLTAEGTCANFPANFIPLASVAYVTAANSAGDHLVVGSLAGGISSLGTLPQPASTNQTYCDAQVQLAPQQFYPNVYVPTAAERLGDFSAFAGLLVDPANNQPFAGGLIPLHRLGAVYAFRIGPAQATSAARGWSPTGSMSMQRAYHAAVLLPSGKVLVVGDITGETYDPTTGAFTPTNDMLFDHYQDFTATQLKDGRVLIVGGGGAPFSAELYEPPTGKFVATGGTVAPHGYSATATLLADGRVLVAGGFDISASVNVAAAEIYDPTAGSFTKTGSLTSNRAGHTATLLQDGRVLVAGGSNTTQLLNSAEMFDPATGQFSSAGAMHVRRVRHFAIRLPSGKVLIGSGEFAGNSTAELFDPATGTFGLTGSMSARRDLPTATLLSSGQVLVAGGGNVDDITFTNSTELYNSATGGFSPTGSMVSARSNHTATALSDGRVLVTGGYSVVGGVETGLSSAELYTPVTQGLITSQTGLTFRAAQGAGASIQNVVALSATDTIPFTVSTKTYSGGANWLGARPGSAISGPGAPTTITVVADATGLAAQDYYGAVTLTPTDGQHPPVLIAVVLTIVPAGTAAPPAVTPSGLVFLAITGTNAKPQAFTISNLTSVPITFTGVAAATPTFFDFAPKNGMINAGQTLSINVTPSSSGLMAGVYRGSIKLTFGDMSMQTVDLLLVTSATAGNAVSRAATACAPTKLLPVLTSIGAGFTTPVAWPTPIVVQVVDDCGTAINAGSVTSSFTNGDGPLALLGIGNGMWSGTWVPVHNAAGAGVRADAQVLNPLLNGTVQVTGQVALNPKVPIVGAGGVVSSGDYMGSPAQGLLVSIFGTALADGVVINGSLPLPQQLGSTSVYVSGVQVPLLYVSDSQVNAFIPYELAKNAPHQLIVVRGGAISVPVPITVFESQPAILATAGNGIGQGHVYKADALGNQTLADAQSPVTAGDIVVIYSVGLGSVNPPVKSGDPASFTTLSQATAPVAVSIGGQTAVVQFAGLTPGFSGLYQVNAVVPSGVTAGSKVPVTVSVSGSSSSMGIYMAVK
jgi:uncharacterized protein (TIGR03437 family)